MQTRLGEVPWLLIGPLHNPLNCSHQRAAFFVGWTKNREELKRSGFLSENERTASRTCLASGFGSIFSASCLGGAGAESAVAGSDFPQPSQPVPPRFLLFFTPRLPRPMISMRAAATRQEERVRGYSGIYSCHDDFEEPGCLPFPITSLSSPAVVIRELSAGPE